MATTRIMPLHIGKGRTESRAISDIIDYVGDVREENIVDKINMYLKKYMNDMELRKKKSLQMQRFIDGKGAERIAEALIAL